jgi:hypothetical protein
MQLKCKDATSIPKPARYQRRRIAKQWRSPVELACSLYVPRRHPGHSTGLYPKWFLKEFPAFRVDIILSTHAHFDHDAMERPKGLMVLERLVGQFNLGDIEITGLADKHKCEPASADKPDSASADLRVETCPPNNVIAFDNAIQIIATGGLRIAIWGDNRATPDPALDHYLKNVDVLILPIESILTRAEVDAIVGKYNPKRL